MIDPPPACELDQQAVEQKGIGAAGERQLQVGLLAGRRTAGIDIDDPRPARRTVADHPLKQHRMAPGSVGADEDDQVSFVQVIVATWHDVLAERPLVTGDRGCHAQARVGIDVGRADEPLHQLIGDVVVLRQQLARDVEGNGIGAVAVDHPGEAAGHGVQRLVPTDPCIADHRIEQAVVEAQRFAQRRALGAQPAEVGGMVGITAYLPAAAPIRFRQDAAADATVGTGRA